MAEYVVKVPDGSTLVIRGPDNADPQLVLSEAKRLYEERLSKLKSMPYSEVTQDVTPDQGTTELGPVGRAVRGVIKGAVVDPMEAIAQVVGGEAGRAGVAQREQSYQAGRQSRGETGLELSRLAGNVLSPASIAPAGMVLKALSGAGRGTQLAAGAATGAVGAATMPVEEAAVDLGDFAVQKIEQAGLGAVIGGLVAGGIQSMKGGTKLLRDLSRPLSEKGKKELMREWLDSLIGPNKEQVLKALQGAEEIVPGSRPTVAEAVSGVPTAAPLAAAQERIAREAGGEFAQRAAEQQGARLGALDVFGNPAQIPQMEAARTAATAPVREAALEQANIAGAVAPRLEADVAAREASRINALQQQGQFQTIAGQQSNLAQNFTGPSGATLGMPRISGRYSENFDRVAEAIDAAKDAGNIVAQRAAERDFKAMQLKSLADEGFFPLKVNDIVGNIDSIRVAPGQRSSDVVRNTFDSLRQKLTNPEYVKPNGIIDSRDLYTIRKEIGNDIAKYAKESQNWDKRLTAGLEKNIKSYIDNAIEGAGGVQWKQYLSDYARHSQKINQAQIGRELSDSLRNALDIEKATTFATAVRNAPSTIQTASGAARFGSAEEVLTPQQISAMNSVLADLQRGVKAKELAGFSRQQGIEFKETDFPSLLNRVATITNSILKRLKRDANADINQQLAQLFLDPQAMATFISSVPKSKAKQVVEMLVPRMNDQNRQVFMNLLTVQPAVKATESPEPAMMQ